MKIKILSFFTYNNLAFFLFGVLISNFCYLGYFALLNGIDYDLWIIIICCTIYLFLFCYFTFLSGYIIYLLLSIIIINYRLKIFFTILITLLIINISVKCGLFDVGIILAEGSELDSLRQQFELEKSDFKVQHDSLKDKAIRVRDFFHSYTLGVEYSIGKDKLTPIMNETVEESNCDIRMNTLHTQLYYMRMDLKHDANILMQKLHRLNTMEWHIHCKANTRDEFSVKEYQEICNQIAKYRDPKWYLADSENIGRFKNIP